MEQYGSGYSNWGMLLLDVTRDFYQVAILGDQSLEKSRELQKNYLPNTVFAGGVSANLPMLQDKESADNTTIFVCYDGTCLLPTTDVKAALQLMIRK
jgi:uncharacterized protein YyaL (SSP411 family)